ncbi:hypothetical protein [Spiroplasma alleghenense]|uniref:Uncharacterized protein n=1 Tax=Spiroplasma alleghenense TaxID=216931 RepID=A0A345Z460_9MOLU|nr:hypothetical protein [Spiroplasma alleghenense]AXK51389.1 hypothetical protein SALLE_v1c07190 [Spiroplasma alleghenense]
MGLFKKKNENKNDKTSSVEDGVKERQPNHWAFDDDPILNLDPVFSDKNSDENVNPVGQQVGISEQENQALVKEHLETLRAKKPALSGQLGQVIANAQKNSENLISELEESNPVISKLRRIEEARKSGIHSDDLYTDLTKSELNSYSNRARDYLEQNSQKGYETDLQRARRLEAEQAKKRENNLDNTLASTKSFNFRVAEKNSQKADRFHKSHTLELGQDDFDIERTNELIMIQDNIEQKLKILSEKEILLNEKQKELEELSKKIDKFQKMYGKKPHSEELIKETQKYLQKNEEEKKALKKSLELLNKKASNSSIQNPSPLTTPTKKEPNLIIPRKRNQISEDKINSRGNDRFLDPTLILPREKVFLESLESIKKLPENQQEKSFKSISKNFAKLEKKIDRLIEKTSEMEMSIELLENNDLQTPELISKTIETKSNFVKAMRKINKEMPKIKSDFQNLSLKDRRKQIYENASIASAGRANKLKVINSQVAKGGFERVAQPKDSWQSNYHKQLQNHGNLQYMRDRNPIFERMMKMNEKANLTLTMEIPVAKANQKGWNNTMVMAKARELDNKADTIEFKEVITSSDSKRWKDYFKN